MSTRIVLTDVTVTDGQGNPVRDLKPSDFHIFDNNHPEPVASFEEHTPSLAPAVFSAPANPAIVSNDFLLHPPSPINVILLDTTTIGIVDQMVLYQHLTRFISRLPPGEPLAIYNRSGDLTLLLQSFTDDHALLMTAIRRAIPQFRSPDAPYTRDDDILKQMAASLSQVPGRKNILWFSGGSNIYAGSDPFNPDAYMDAPSRRPLYDLLEAERIAVYPIDARGLTWGGIPTALQHMQMEEDAQATGGIAFYNNNGLAKITAHIISTDSSYYTLTYAPQGLHRDGKWHKVKIALDDPRYHLSYRRGYFDDGLNDPPPPGESRTLLRADGTPARVPNHTGDPIIFQARVLPASISPPTETAGIIPSPPKKGQTVYTVHYTLPASALQTGGIADNIGTDTVRSAIIAFDHDGNVMARGLQTVSIRVPVDTLRREPKAVLDFDQQINLPHGEEDLLLVVWDPTTGNFGTANLSMDVKKTPRTKL